MNFLKTKLGKAILGFIVALGVLAGTLLNETDTTSVDVPAVYESQQVGG